MEERKFCQCCAMPLDKPEDQGTEVDGSLSGDYCRYCYQKGAFTAPDATMDDIIAFNLKLYRPCMPLCWPVREVPAPQYFRLFM